MAKQLRGTVIISVLRASDLHNADSGLSKTDVSDPFVKVTALSPDGKPLIKFRTRTVDNSLNPVWNEQFSVILDSPTSHITVDFEVFDQDVVDSQELGFAQVKVTPDFNWDVDNNYSLKPRKKEKVKGSVSVSFSYREGEQVDLNKQAKERKESQKNWKELPNEAKQNIKEFRARKECFTEGEEAKMVLLNEIFRSNFGSPSPVFGITDDNLLMFKFKKSTWKIGENDLTVAPWFRKMEDKKGEFVNEAKDIIEEVCKFQGLKSSSYRDGYLNDPEGLFCEEIKNWASDQLSIMSIQAGALELIQKRIGYLEECLLVSHLFDRPSSLAKATIQQAIVSVRRILKYRAIANIEKELAHEDASRDLAILKRCLTGLIRCCYKFLYTVFRCESSQDAMSAADRLLLAVQADENIKHVLSDQMKEMTELVRGMQASATDAPWQKLDLREKGLKPTKSFLDPTKLDVKDPHLPFVFVGPQSGVEEWFRSNAFIAFKFLKCHGLLIETARLFVVIEKAANLAKTGGTLLVFGLGNAHLNATLDATKSIMDVLKEEFNAISKIAECCFEELVYANQATKERTRWITHFKNVFPGINEINKAIKEIQKVSSDIKHTANSVSLLQRFQQAANEQSEFVNTAEEFSKRMCEVSGKPYVPPKPKEVSAEDAEAWKKLIKQ